MSKVLVVGGGAAGMFAAIFAARSGSEVHLYEKNEKLGKKLFITGKGRCNITNASDMEVLFASVLTNPKFLYSSFYGYTNEDVIQFFEEAGLHTKVERGNRVFPKSDHSSDVIGTLVRILNRERVKIYLHQEVEKVVSKEGIFENLILKDGTAVYGDACIVATGGCSYQTTGSTGDGYRFAKENGHQVSDLLPALVPMNVKEGFVKELQGLSLRNVKAAVYQGKKLLYEEFGEMLFTHYGVSGPLMLSASSVVGKQLRKEALRLEIDLKPALSEEQLDQRVLREFEEYKNKQFKNAVHKLFVHQIKHFEMTLTGLRDFNEAIITKGGIKVKDIDPGTMESKLIKGLYFAGEVLDLDALTGGFNLQIAWSTGYAAGIAAGSQES